MWSVALPFFLFFSWSVGRSIPLELQIAPMVAVAVFFGASSIGPVIIPWERRAGTYERLLTAPVSLLAILIGKGLAGTFFGVVVAIVAILFGWFMGVPVTNWAATLLAVALSSGVFSALGILFSSIATQDVAAVMMPSTLVRWPLLFVSGILIPFESMPKVGRWLGLCSPLTYTADAVRHGIQGAGIFPFEVDCMVLVGFWLLLLGGSIALHKRGLSNA